MIKRFLVLFLIVFFFFCTKKKTIEIDYSDGSLKELYHIDVNGKKDGEYKLFYKNGSLKEFRLYNRGNIVDTIKYYNRKGILTGGSFSLIDSIYTFQIENGNIIKEGMNLKSLNMKDDEFNGWIKYYEKGILKKKIYYVYVEEKGALINKYYVYNQESKQIIEEKSLYYNLKMPDTILINKEYSVGIDFKSNAIKTIGFFSITSNKIFKNFSNLNSVDVDTVYNDASPKIIFKLDQIGDVFLRGKFTEQYLITEENKKDSTKLDVSVKYRDFYFEKRIFVIENKKINLQENVKIQSNLG